MTGGALDGSALDALHWAWLDPSGAADASATSRPPGPPQSGQGERGGPAVPLSEPVVARRFAQICLDHVLLRELVQEEAASLAAPCAGLSDAELVHAALAHRVPGAFDLLVERYFNLTAAAAYALLSDAEAARDVAQDAFLEAARTLPLLREPAKFANWVYGIARRKAIYVLRRRKLHHQALEYKQDAERALPPAEEAGAPLARQERAGEIRRALDQLPEIYREVLVLKYMDGRSYEEIATLLGLRQAAVDKRLTRAKAMLRESLRPWMGD